MVGRLRGATSAAVVATGDLSGLIEGSFEENWPGTDGLGRRFRTPTADGQEFEVVGIAGDYKVQTVGEAPTPYIHFALGQRLSQSLGVGISASLLTFIAGDGPITVPDFKIVFILIALLMASSAVGFRRLKPGDGWQVSGYRGDTV